MVALGPPRSRSLPSPAMLGCTRHPWSTPCLSIRTTWNYSYDPDNTQSGFITIISYKFHTLSYPYLINFMHHVNFSIHPLKFNTEYLTKFHTLSYSYFINYIHHHVNFSIYPWKFKTKYHILEISYTIIFIFHISSYQFAQFTPWNPYERCTFYTVSDTFLRALILVHCGQVMPYGERDLGQHWLR